MPLCVARTVLPPSERKQVSVGTSCFAAMSTRRRARRCAFAGASRAENASVTNRLAQQHPALATPLSSLDPERQAAVARAAADVAVEASGVSIPTREASALAAHVESLDTVAWDLQDAGIRGGRARLWQFPQDPPRPPGRSRPGPRVRAARPGCAAYPARAAHSGQAVKWPPEPNRRPSMMCSARSRRPQSVAGSPGRNACATPAPSHLLGSFGHDWPGTKPCSRSTW
jgi:hypothetical protein